LFYTTYAFLCYYYIDDQQDKMGYFMPSQIPLIRIFLSSPTDMKKEREFVIDYIEKLRQSPLFRNKVAIDIIAWENPKYSTVMPANLTPQEAINKGLYTPSECDIVLVFLGLRMGTPFIHTDGVEYLSGTYWELLDALSSKTTDTVIYRRIEKDLIEGQYDLKQYELVQEFFNGDTFYKNGKILRSVHPYESIANFEELIELHLVQLIQDKINNIESLSSSSDDLERLIDAKHYTQIQNKINELVNRTYDSFNSDEFHTTCQPLRKNVDSRGEHNETWLPIVELYEKVTHPSLLTFMKLAYHGDETQAFIVSQALKDWTKFKNDAWKYSGIRYIPNWLLIYTVGISAISNPKGINWGYLEAIFKGDKVSLASNPSVSVEPWIDTVINLFSLQNITYVMPTNKLSNMTYDIIRPLFLSHIPDDSDFESQFMKFESLLSFFMWYKIQLNQIHGIFMPLRTSCYSIFSIDTEIIQLIEFWSHIGKLGKSWQLLKFFNNDVGELTSKLNNYSEFFSGRGMCQPVRLIDFYNKR
jgi:hypothetical protein